MPNTRQIIEQAASLPVEERALVVDSLLRTLNQPDPDFDRQWAGVATRRLAELRAGRVKPIAAGEVLRKARRRLAK